MLAFDEKLSARRVQTVNRLHRLLTELMAGGAGKDLKKTKAKRLLATVRPRSATRAAVGRATRPTVVWRPDKAPSSSR